MKINIKILVLLLLLIQGCSYELINSPNREKIFVQAINVNGDTRSAFIIKKSLMRKSKKGSKNRIEMDIDLLEKVSIVEKNIQNQVTKYKINLEAKVSVNELKSDRDYSKNYTSEKTYDVGDRYSITVENSKQAKKTSLDNLINQILDDLNLYYNQ